MNECKWLLFGLMALALGACASGPPPIHRLEAKARTVDASFDRTWDAVNDVLSEMRLPIRAFEKESGLVTTDFLDSGERYVFVGKKTDEGKELSQWAQKTRYFLNIRVREAGDGASVVEVIPRFEYMLYRYDYRLKRYIEAGWQPCDSHGDVEQGIYVSLAAKLAR